jgi:hypothetical protein
MKNARFVLPVVLALVVVAWGLASCSDSPQEGTGLATDGANTLDQGGLSDGANDGNGTDDAAAVEIIEGSVPDFGDPCKSDADCDSGYCIEGYNGFFCTQTCKDQCPTGYKCQKVFTSEAPVYLCVAPISKLCHTCKTDLDCGGARCITSGEESFCSTYCPTGSDGCPASHTCGKSPAPDGSDDLDICLPKTGSCNCSSSTQGLVRACKQSTGPNVCYGVQLCGNTGWSGCQLPTEICDGADNDCNGKIDDGYVDAKGKYTTVQACGGCGNNCNVLKFANAVNYCQATATATGCSFTCNPPYFDVNDNPKDGCECKFASDLDIPDGPDQNCDGIDGEIENAIFVNRTGVDIAKGTREDPVASLQKGIDLAKAAGKRDVYVASGVYEETLVLATGVHVYGGYSADFRFHDPAAYETAVLGKVPSAEAPGTVNALDLGAGEATFDGFTVFGANVKQKGASTYGIYVRNPGPGLKIVGNRVIAGDAGNGQSGVAGVNGDNGVGGSAGAKAKDIGAYTCGSEHQSTGGNGGSRTCGGQNVGGGKGGNAICPDYDEDGSQPKSSPYKQTQTAAEQGTAGQGPSAGGGGSSGYDSLIWEGSSSCGLCNVPRKDETSAFLDTVGTNGGNGKDGSLGDPGAACASNSGQVVGGKWQPDLASGGGDGLVGSGGGGGAAGGGVEVSAACKGSDPKFKYPDIGGSGGGGGSGGCGATGGKAGGSGGGSFALFIVYTDAALGVPAVTDNLFVTGNGGYGGQGGQGGVGGVGGDGAFGGADDGGGLAWCASAGGTGGKGGKGGHGGGGGGGCGGVSFGLFVANANGLDPAAMKKANFVQLLGTAGMGGAGGKSLGQGGGNGPDGAGGDANF